MWFIWGIKDEFEKHFFYCISNTDTADTILIKFFTPDRIYTDILAAYNTDDEARYLYTDINKNSLLFSGTKQSGHTCTKH